MRNTRRPGHRGSTASRPIMIAAIALVAAVMIGQTASAQTDTTAPSLSEAVVNGNTLTLTFDEPLDSSSTPPAGAFVVDYWDFDQTLSSVSVSGSTVVLTLSDTVTTATIVGVAYTQPADQNEGRIKDSAGNAAESFERTVATNSTPSTYGNPISGFSVLNAGDATVLTTITDGANVILSNPTGGSFAIRADLDSNITAPDAVDIYLTGTKNTMTYLSDAPYALFRRRSDAGLVGESLPVGDYTLRAEAFKHEPLTGNNRAPGAYAVVMMGSLEVDFTVVVGGL